MHVVGEEYRAAAATGDAYAITELADFLARLARWDEAEMWCRPATDTGVPRAMTSYAT